MYRKTLKFIVLVIIIWSSGTIDALALNTADSYKLLEPLPCVAGAGQNCKEGEVMTEVNLAEYIGYVFKLAIALSAFLAVVVIMWAGFRYMTLESIPDKVDARTRIQNAVFGLLAVLGSYLILNTIDPRLTNINTSIPPLEYRKSVNTRELNNQLLRAQQDYINKNVLEREQVIANNKKEVASLYLKMEDEVLTQEQYKEISAEIQKLEQENKELAANNTEDRTRGLREIGYQLAVDILKNGSLKYSSDIYGGLSEPTIAKAAIEWNKVMDEYDKAIKEYRDSGNLIEAQKLEDEVRFYDSMYRYERTSQGVIKYVDAQEPKYKYGSETKTLIDNTITAIRNDINKISPTIKDSAFRADFVNQAEKVIQELTNKKTPPKT